MTTSSFFSSSRINIDGIPCLLPSEALEFLKSGAIMVDIRSDLETEIKAFGIERDCYLPHYDFEEKWKTLPVDSPLILADAVGVWSKFYAKFLLNKGLSDVAILAGGIADWEKDGFPIKAGKFQPLNGPCPCMIRPRERK